MNTNINLILPKDKEFLEQQNRLRMVRITAIVFPTLVGIISLIIFLITQAINPVFIKKQQEETINKIAKLQDRKIKIFIINDRLENIGQILEKRRNFSDNINTLLSKIPSEIFLENLEMDNEALLFTVSSTSLRAIDEFINNLIDMGQRKEVIHSLSLDTLAFDEDKSNYLVSFKSKL